VPTRRWPRHALKILPGAGARACQEARAHPVAVPGESRASVRARGEAAHTREADRLLERAVEPSHPAAAPRARAGPSRGAEDAARTTLG
jgi:hypothetical protein